MYILISHYFGKELKYLERKNLCCSKKLGIYGRRESHAIPALPSGNPQSCVLQQPVGSFKE